MKKASRFHITGKSEGLHGCQLHSTPWHPLHHGNQTVWCNGVRTHTHTQTRARTCRACEKQLETSRYMKIDPSEKNHATCWKNLTGPQRKNVAALCTLPWRCSHQLLAPLQRVTVPSLTLAHLPLSRSGSTCRSREIKIDGPDELLPWVQIARVHLRNCFIARVLGTAIFKDYKSMFTNQKFPLQNALASRGFWQQVKNAFCSIIILEPF